MFYFGVFKSVCIFDKRKTQNTMKRNAVFQFENITDEEFILYAKTCNNNGMTKEEILLEAECISDLLGLIKMRSIIVGQSFTKTGRKRKDSDLSTLIGNRIGVLIEETKNINK